MNTQPFANSIGVLNRNAWRTNSRANLNEPRSLVHTPGAASLEHTAIRCCLRNIRDIQPGVLSSLPNTLLRKVWRHVVSSGYDSLEMWKCFRTVLHNDDDDTLKRHIMTVREDATSLQEIAKAIVSPEFSYLSMLALVHVSIPRAQILHISNISNLTLLLLQDVLIWHEEPSGCDYTAPIGFREIWLWTQTVESGGFANLQTLMLLEPHHNEQKTLETVSQFPRISVCGFLKRLNWPTEEVVASWQPVPPEIEQKLNSSIMEWWQLNHTIHQTLYEIHNIIHNEDFVALVPKNERVSTPAVNSTLSLCYGHICTTAESGSNLDLFTVKWHIPMGKSNLSRGTKHKRSDDEGNRRKKPTLTARKTQNLLGGLLDGF